MGTLNSTGYETLTFAEIKELYQQAYKDAYGEDIDLSEESPEGVLIDKKADLMNDCEQSGLDIFNNFNISRASGIMLSDIAVLKGTTRRAGTRAVISAILTSSSVPYTIPANNQFKHTDTSTLFENLVETVVASSTQNVELRALEVGLVDMNAGEKLTSNTFIPELTDIEIGASGISYGSDAESDLDLRNRLLTTDNPNSQGDVNAIYTALANLIDVEKVNVLENATPAEDLNGVPAYSINPIVLGGATQDIVDTIFPKKSGGTQTYGAVTGTTLDIAGNSHNVMFDRPDKVNIYVSCTCTARDGDLAVDGSFEEVIRENTQAYINSLRIGKDVSYTTVYGIFAEPKAFDIVGLEMSSTSLDDDMNANNVVIDVREYASLDDEDADIRIVVD
jgi:uncharacterized phage protein gp47/JayE